MLRATAAAPPRSRSPSPASRLADDAGPARGGPRRPRPGRPDPHRRQRRCGRSTRRSRAIPLLDRAAGGLEYVEQPVRRSRTSPPYAGGSTYRSPPTSRSAGPRTPTGCATSTPPTSRCSRCSRSAGSAPACGSPRTSACPWWCRSALETSRSASPPAWRWRRRCPSCPTPAASPPCSCSPTTSRSEPLLPVDGALPVVRPELDAAALARTRARRRPRGALAGPAGFGRFAGMTPANASTALAATVVDALVRVRRPGRRPGARLPQRRAGLRGDDAAQGRLRLHTRIDERSAGFLALGLAEPAGDRSRWSPPAAPRSANLHPAVLEASHAGLPLLVVTADRPARLRGTDANQTTDQARIFGGAVRDHADLPAAHPGSGEVEQRQVASWRAIAARAAATARVGWADGRAGAPQPPVRGAARPRRLRRVGLPARRRPRGTPLDAARRPAAGPADAARAPTCARWWWPATTPGRPRGCSRSGPAGRCSPSPPAARAPATT